MTKQSFITFSCDAATCDNSTVGEREDAFLMAPPGWFSVDTPDGPVIDDEDTRHFCSTSCLADWAVEQAHLRRP